MHWQDEAIVISVRPHGETSLILEVLARAHGRTLGLVKGGRSPRVRPAVQPGNLVSAGWRARLSEHLGNFDVELMTGYAARAMASRVALAMVTSMCFFAKFLPERDPHPALFDAMLGVLDALEEPGRAACLCPLRDAAARGDGIRARSVGMRGDGRDGELIYVSPKSGRAVSAKAGRPYRDRLLPLPAFLIDASAPISAGDIAGALRLSGFFLERHLREAAGARLPEERGRIVAHILRTGGGEA
jgi:DNA repair protein RecO